MITKIHLENFKGVKERQTIELKPITLLFGPNSSGKSTVVQALHYLIAGTADAPRTDFSRSLIMFRPGFRGEAERLADDVRIKRVTPLDGMKSNDLGGAHVLLIVGQS